jgi:hypothetical protein
MLGLKHQEARWLEPPSVPLGTDYAAACGSDGNGGRAAILNALFDKWRKQRAGEPVEQHPTVAGTVHWLFREYKKTKAYLEKVSERSRPDYERTMQLVTDITTKKGDRVGDRPIKAITPRSANRIYEIVLEGPNGLRPRQAEKVVGLCARAWSVVHRLHPEMFDRIVPNPRRGVTKNRRTKTIKPHAAREQVHAFAYTAIERGHPEIAAAAIMCFDFLQRPENVIAGHIGWNDYRGKDAPTAIRILHHKTDAVVLHPLEDRDGTPFYADAEAILAQVPRRGVPMVRHVPRGKARDGKPHTAKPYAMSSVQHLVQRLRKAAGLPPTFTLDACRHGGMTELEEAELTGGQGRALSAHKSRAYEAYQAHNGPRSRCHAQTARTPLGQRLRNVFRAWQQNSVREWR